MKAVVIGPGRIGCGLAGQALHASGYAVTFVARDRRIVEHLYLSAFSRYPRESEKSALLADLEKSRLAKGTPEAMRDAHRQSLEDMMWALLTSKEFLFNH